jgi:hypothetical protein
MVMAHVMGLPVEESLAGALPFLGALWIAIVASIRKPRGFARPRLKTGRQATQAPSSSKAPRVQSVHGAHCICARCRGARA